MFSCPITEIQEKMNKAAQEALPFLFAINYEQTEGVFIAHPLRQQEVLFRVPGYTNAQKKVKENSEIHEIYFEAFPESYAVYKKRFDIVLKALQKGDSFLTNLTIKTPIQTNLSLPEIFIKSQSPYALYIPEKMVCFSPEIFVRINEEGRISSYPMKGTIDGSLPEARETILNDYKESAEHFTIVDLIRNDLSMVSENVRVDRLRYIDELHTTKGSILQVSSEISGLISKDNTLGLGDILLRLLPAGSITGAPKPSTQAIIDAAECEPRGYYTGVFGYFDGKVLDTAVMIRFIEQEGDAYYFRSGGGITANSKAEKEYNEAIQKVYLPFNN